METTHSVVRQIAKKVIPTPWRAPLRRILFEQDFHPYPRRFFSRHRPWRMPLGAWLAYEARYRWWRCTRGRGQRLERPIFIIGCPRSGTSIFLRTFSLHPDVANLSEAPEIWDPLHYRDLDADDSWTAEDVRPEDVARLHARFEFHRRWQRKARFVNKHPPSSVRIDYIRAVFPDAVFIHVIRDGRAVALSIVEFIQRQPRFHHAPMPMCRPPNWRQLVRPDRLEESAEQWRAVVSYILSQRAKLGPAYHEFRYENLCEDPRGVLGAAYRFAGLRVDKEVLGLLAERLESQDYKWKQQLTREQIEMVNRIEGPLLRELGYIL